MQQISIGMNWDELNDKQAAIDTYNEVIKQFPDSKYAERSIDRIADLNEE
jgi:outer membrane protein assembly factor BamD (BamD/ComL family)